MMTNRRSNSGAIAVFALDSCRRDLIWGALQHNWAGELMGATTLVDLSNLVRHDPPRCVILDLNVPTDSDERLAVTLIQGAYCPVAVFVETDDTALMQNSIDAGAAAYVFNGLIAPRVQQVAEMAVRRFNALSRLQDEVQRAKNALLDRKQIDRAKQFLIESRSMTEPDAYALLRKTAMDQNCTISEIAKSLVVSADLLK